MDEKHDLEKLDGVMMPGFRFHPTDEELVGYYLKRKIQQKPLPIELIKQVDIYKYSPWDLPKLVANGEKEWYFYCPRDQKYRNSTRPNRVTGAGFWKATGTDRPIYSSEGTKCIGLKKSLVFYKGRAARGIKTDWMMHEFRLPPISNSPQTKRPGEKKVPANDSWAICRIFKKTSSMAQRAPSHSWVLSPLPENTSFQPNSQAQHGTQVTSRDNTSCPSKAGSEIQFDHSNEAQPFFETNFPPLDAPSYKHSNTTISKEPLFPILNMEYPTSMLFSPFGVGEETKYITEVSSVLQNLTPGIFDNINRASANIDFTARHCKSNTINKQQEIKGDRENAQECFRKNKNSYHENIHWETTEEISFPTNIHLNLSDELKSNLSWDSPQCPSEMPLGYSSAECYNL